MQLGLRPEHIEITDAAEGIWQARLELVSSLGSEAIFYLDLRGRQVLARAAHAEGFQEKQQVGISFDMQHLFVFEKEGGRRIR